MLPSYFNLQDGALEIKEMKISPFGVESVNLVLRAANAGVFDQNRGLSMSMN